MEHRNNKYTSDFHAKSLRLNVTGYYLAIHSSVHIYFLFALVWIRFFLSSFMRNGRSILFFFSSSVLSAAAAHFAPRKIMFHVAAGQIADERSIGDRRNRLRYFRMIATQRWRW